MKVLFTANWVFFCWHFEQLMSIFLGSGFKGERDPGRWPSLLILYPKWEPSARRLSTPTGPLVPTENRNTSSSPTPPAPQTHTHTHSVLAGSLVLPVEETKYLSTQTWCWCVSDGSAVVLHVENYPPQNDSQILACYLHRAVCVFFFWAVGCVCVALREPDSGWRVENVTVAGNVTARACVRACTPATDDYANCV